MTKKTSKKTNIKNKKPHREAIVSSQPIVPVPEKERPFKPSAGMRAWFNAAVELGAFAKIQAIARKANIDRINWYYWIKNPRFCEWWNREWDNYLAASKWRLDAIGLEKAERDFDYWVTMQRRVGNLDREPVGNQSPNNTQFNINIGTDQLKRIVDDE